MIAKGDLICIGYIKRPHGFKGEIQIQLNKEIALSQGDFVFISLEGHYIPYPIDRVNTKTKEPIVKLRFIDDENEAKNISAHEVYIESKEILSDNEVSLIGFMLIDKQLGKLSKVIDIAYLPQQIMLVIEYEGKECYIPINEQFITLIQEENKEIYCNLPPGLLDL